MKPEYVFFITAIGIGLIGSWVFPASRFSAAAMRLRARFNGTLIVALFFLIAVLFGAGVYILLRIFDVEQYIRAVVLGFIVGTVFVLTPLIDKRNAEKTKQKDSDKNEEKQK